MNDDTIGDALLRRREAARRGEWPPGAACNECGWVTCACEPLDDAFLRTPALLLVRKDDR